VDSPPVTTSMRAPARGGRFPALACQGIGCIGLSDPPSLVDRTTPRAQNESNVELSEFLRRSRIRITPGTRRHEQQRTAHSSPRIHITHGIAGE
jgi:hypothetical protein